MPFSLDRPPPAFQDVLRVNVRKPAIFGNHLQSFFFTELYSHDFSSLNFIFLWLPHSNNLLSARFTLPL